jgi:VWFA-related protein
MRALLTATALAVLAWSGAAQQPVFRAGAQTVPVYATVRDAAGHLVPGLSRADFQVFDDGRPAAVTTFSDDVLPAGIGLLLDMSTSMIGEHARVRDAALRFVDALLPDDRVRIGTFGDEITLSPWLTSDKAILGRVLREEVWPGGDTPLWTAMRAGMASLAAETGRRVIVALTDGIDTGCPRLIGFTSSGLNQVVRSQEARRPETTTASTGDTDRVVRLLRRVVPRQEALRAQATLSSSGTRTSAVLGQELGRARPALRDDASQAGGRSSALDARESLCASFDEVERLALDREFLVYAIGMEGPGLGGSLIRLVDDTGGGHFELKRNQDLAASFREVLDELHHQYALGFTPVALDGRTHVLEVRLARKGLTARARKSYVAVPR